MGKPKKILVAIDLSEECDQVLAKAAELIETYRVTASLIHVVEPVVTDSNYMLPETYVDLESVLQKRAKDFLDEKAKQFSNTKVSTICEVGSTKHEIFRQVEESGYDLIVMGTHGRHGIARLLGSTASAVLHGTPCDIYMVKIA